MGDKEFENFLNEEDHGDDQEGPVPVPSCQKRLLFDIIKQKMNGTADLIGILSDLHIKYPEEGYKKDINRLLSINKISLEQLDYIMSVVIDEINGEEEGGGGGGENTG